MARRTRSVLLIVGGLIAIAVGAVGIVTSGGDPKGVDVDAEQFVADLSTALATRDTTFLLAHLDPVVLRTYGRKACASRVARLDPEGTLRVVGSEEPTDYTWEVDDRSVVVAKVVTVHTQFELRAEQDEHDVHVGTATGTPTWFTDCGVPLTGGDQ